MYISINIKIEIIKAINTPCGLRKYIKNGREVSGGRCILNNSYRNKVKRSKNPADWQKWFAAEERKFMTLKKFGTTVPGKMSWSKNMPWKSDVYFKWPETENDWEPGFICQGKIASSLSFWIDYPKET